MQMIPKKALQKIPSRHTIKNVASKTSITSKTSEAKQIVVRNVAATTHHALKAAALERGLALGPFLSVLLAEWKKRQGGKAA
jgi:hypothetical protein